MYNYNQVHTAHIYPPPSKDQSLHKTFERSVFSMVASLLEFPLEKKDNFKHTWNVMICFQHPEFWSVPCDRIILKR